MTTHASVPGDSSSFRFGEFTFDCGSRLLTSNGAKRHLSPKAQQLLQMLLLARPRAVAREALYEALWPATFVCETNLAGVVSELRRVLGDDARTSRYIRTVHGYGYAFCGEVVASASAKAPVATLRIDGQHYPLYDGDNVVGRAEDCRVMIMVSTVSRRHALIAITAVGMTIRDLDSTNGTYVDGKRIGSAPVPLQHRAQIAFGAVAATVAFRSTPRTDTHELHSGERRLLRN